MTPLKQENEWFGGVWLILFCIVLTTCAKPMESGLPKPAQTMRWAMSGECKAISPFDTNPHCAALSKLVYSTLIKSVVKPGEVTLTPFLAEKWDRDNSNRLRISIRKDVVWPNGDLLTPQHFLNRWEMILTDPRFAAFAPLLFGIKNGRAIHKRASPFSNLGVEILDRNTLIIDVDSPHQNVLESLSHPALSPQFGRHPPTINPTLGPYTIDAFSGKLGVVLKPNPRFKVHLEPLSEITIEFSRSVEDLDQSSFDGYLTGQTNGEKNDSLVVPPAPLVAVHISSASGLHLVLNPRKPLLSQRTTRRALMTALVPDEVIHLLKWGHRRVESVAHSIAGAGAHWFPKTDVELARRLLKEANPVDSTVPTLHHPSIPEGFALARNLQAQWLSTLGIHFDLFPVSGNHFGRANIEFFAAIVPTHHGRVSDLESLRRIWENLIFNNLTPSSRYVPFESSLLPWISLTQENTASLEEWLIGKEYLVLPILTLSTTAYLRSTLTGLTQDVFFLVDISLVRPGTGL